MKNSYLDIINSPAFKEAAKLLTNPEIIQQQKILAELKPTWTAMQNASATMSKISPMYLRSLNQATEMLKHVDMATLARSTEFACELIPVAMMTQRFLTIMGNVEPTVAEKTFEVLSAQTLNDEIILPPEAPKVTEGLISTLKRKGRKVLTFIADSVIDVKAVIGIDLADISSLDVGTIIAVVVRLFDRIRWFQNDESE